MMQNSRQRVFSLTYVVAMIEAAAVAIACCRAAPDAPGDDLYPDPDSDLLMQTLVAMGVSSCKVAWDNAAIDWGGFAVVIMRSTWDGIDRPDEFLRWVRQVDASSMVQNPAPIVEWNIDKSYLRDLAELDIPTIPTQWVAPGEAWEAPGGEFIVKPAIASGARNTARYSAAKSSVATQHVSMLGDDGQTSLVQAYMPSVESQGETSLVFIDGRFSHAIRKGGFLNLDEGILEKPWERMSYLGPCEPSPAEISLAERTFDVVQQRTPEPLVYGRDDLIADGRGDATVIEVELIDPHLSLTAVPRAASALAQAIVRLI